MARAAKEREAAGSRGKERESNQTKAKSGNRRKAQLRKAAPVGSRENTPLRASPSRAYSNVTAKLRSAVYNRPTRNVAPRTITVPLDVQAYWDLPRPRPTS